MKTEPWLGSGVTPNMNRIAGLAVAALVIVLTLYGVYYFVNNLILGNRNAPVSEAPAAEAEYIIDADTANEIDDLFAIVGAIARDDRGRTGPRLAGLTAAHFHNSPLATDHSAEESQAINEELARLLERPQLRALVGANGPLRNAETPRRSPAAAFIAERASLATPQNKLQVFILGPATNLASAILLDPAIAERIHARYLGFWQDEKTGRFDLDEFNTGNDPLALDLLLQNPDLEFSVMTATTSEALQFYRAGLEERLPGHRVSPYLLRRWDAFDRWWTEDDPGKSQWTMWDVASVEAWFEPQLVRDTVLAAPTLRGKKIRVYTQIDAAAMRDNYFGTLKRWAAR